MSSNSDERRFQYRIVQVGLILAVDRMQVALGELGAHGWELVTVFDKSSNWIGGTEKGFLLFKREVPAGEEPVGAWCIVDDRKTMALWFARAASVEQVG